VIQFTVTTQGNVTDFENINSVCPAIDNEVILALNKTNGMWIPGRNNGNPVDMSIVITFVFYEIKIQTILFTRFLQRTLKKILTKAVKCSMKRKMQKKR